MGWYINEVKNTVEISDKCAKELYDLDTGTWWSLEDVVSDGKLYFDTDHMEHMDYLATHDDIVEVLKKYKVEGDICFSSEEGDNAGEKWGYRFDGKGGMKYLSATVTWTED